MMRIISCILFILVLLLGVSFAILNSQPVAINYYLNNTSIALSLLLVLVLGVGIIIGWLTGLLLWLRAKAENRRLNRQIKLLEKEVTNLRMSPIKDTP